MNNLRENPTYRGFVNKRNKALEYILSQYMSKQNRVLEELETRAVEICTSPFYSINAMSTRLDHEFSAAVPRFAKIYYQLRTDAYVLAYAGEAEAIGRATNTRSRVKLDRTQLDRRLHKQSPSGGDVQSRIALVLQRLKHRILDSVALSRTLAEEYPELRKRVQRAFPPSRQVLRPPRKLPRLTEATTPNRKPSLVTGIIDDAAWQDLVDEYLGATENLRGPKDTATKDGEQRYTWEIERDLTQDFVEEVRAGQIDAAKENGITDFVWVAIVDDRTDECCLWRDGLTTSEIKQKLSSKRDDCDAVVPPAHFNCRCDVAPVTDKEGNEPKAELGDFESWLTS